jgi:hypothetical protein
MNRINRSWVDVNRLGSPVTKSMIEVVAASSLDRVIAERDGLQISLNTADQSIDDLNAAISRRTHRVRELEAQLAYAVDALNEVVKASAMYEKPFEIATLAIGEMSAVKPASSRAEVKLRPEGTLSNDIPTGQNGHISIGRLDPEPNRIKGMIETVGGEYAVMIDQANRHYGWTFKKHPDGQWVSGRPATEAEMNAARAHAQITNQL